MLYFPCQHCNARFRRRDNMMRHFQRVHVNKKLAYDCPLCGALYPNVVQLHNHIVAHQPDTEYKVVDNLYSSSAVHYRKRYVPAKPSLELTLGQDFDNITRILASEAARKKYAKFRITVVAEFVQIDYTKNEITDSICMYFPSTQFVLTLYQNYQVHVHHAYNQISRDMEDFLNSGSNWVLNAVYRTDLKVNRSQPLAGSCSLELTDTDKMRSLPKGHLVKIPQYQWVNDSANQLNAAISIAKQLKTIDYNGDNRCFFYAIAYYFLRMENRVAKRDLPAYTNMQLAEYVYKNFVTDGIRVPTPVQDIAKFERVNNATRDRQQKLKINVLFREEDSVIYPVYVSSQSEWKHNINLLLYKTESPDGKAISHYSYVPNLDSLLRRFYRGKSGSLSYEKTYVCENCLNKFNTKVARYNHFETCRKNAAQAVSMPKFGETLQFKNYSKKFKIPLVGFFDFESVMVKPEAPCPSCQNSSMCYHKTEIEAIQQAGTYTLIVLDHKGNFVHNSTYSGDDCAAHFMETLLDLEPDFLKYLNEKKPMELTRQQEDAFQKADQCHICDKKFRQQDIRVRDHCHLTGDFMGAAHQVCNLNRVVVKKIPLLCHNFTGYDSHIIVQGMKKDHRLRTLKALPRNTEKFRTIQINSYHFLDSMSFLDGSLADVVDDLRNSGHIFPLLEKTDLCMGRSPYHKKLLLQKGIYPYEFAKSVQQLRDYKGLPGIEHFYSKVANSGVSLEDYQHAEEVFRQFSCGNMLDYCEVYCQLDTILLAECFLSFRAEVEKEFELDCCHYISLPQLAFDGMLKMTEAVIECLSDVDMMLFLESNIRGGVSFINQRYCQNTYDRVLEQTGSSKAAETASEQDEAEKMLYIDANNLYGYAQSCPMPIGGYQWMTEEEKAAKDWTEYDQSSSTGYILEVDLDYPEELHLIHNSLPLAPHRMDIDQTIISPYSLQCLQRLKGRSLHSSLKLVSTFLPRRKYVVHAANLALYLSLGMKLVAVHRVLQFRQSNFLKCYIDFCTAKRAASKSEFRKRLFKAFSNSNFGKFIEQTRKHLNCHIVDNKKAFEKWVACPRFQDYKRLGSADSEIVAVFLKRPSVTMRQAWAIGFTILERSKGLIYDHYYNKIRPALGGRCAVIFTDTDSLCLRVKSGQPQIDLMERLRDIIDFSNYPPNHPQYYSANKNRLEYWKDELKGEHLAEFVGLASKTYSMRVAKTPQDSAETKSKCKGVGRGFRRSIPFEEYKKCVEAIDQHRVTQYRIQSTDHVIKTVKMDRLCFSSFDDKRYVMPCGIHSVAYGSRFIIWSQLYNICMFCHPVVNIPI